MNIVQVTGGELRIPVKTGGGAENLVLNISKRLSQAGHSVTILDRKYSPEDPDVEYIDNVKIVRLKARRIAVGNYNIRLTVNQLSLARQVRKYLAKAEFDIVHVHISVMGILLAITNPTLRKRLFYTSHATRRSKRSLTLFDRGIVALENALVKRTRKAIVFNDEMRENFITTYKVQSEDIVALPVGIDVDSFNPNIDTGDIKQRYNLEGKLLILFIGRIHQDKGIEYLVKAANILVNKYVYTDIQFLLVGPTETFGLKENNRSSYLDKIMHLIGDYELHQVVQLTGAVPLDDLKKLYAACDIFALPSVAESSPSAPLEAMASGKPIVATKTYGLPMQVRDGQNGFLVDVADERQLAEKLKYLIDKPEERERMGAYGRRLAEEEFDWNKIAEKLVEIYRPYFTVRSGEQ